MNDHRTDTSNVYFFRFYFQPIKVAKKRTHFFYQNTQKRMIFLASTFSYLLWIFWHFVLSVSRKKNYYKTIRIQKTSVFVRNSKSVIIIIILFNYHTCLYEKVSEIIKYRKQKKKRSGHWKIFLDEEEKNKFQKLTHRNIVWKINLKKKHDKFVYFCYYHFKCCKIIMGLRY